MYNVDIVVVQFTLKYIWLLLLVVSRMMHLNPVYVVECCCMYLVVVMHN
jgi:hypothetical protein